MDEGCLLKIGQEEMNTRQREVFAMLIHSYTLHTGTMRIIQQALDVRARPCSLFLSFKLSLCRSQKTTHPLGVLDRGIGIVVVRLLAVGAGDKRIGVGSPLNLLELAAGTILCLFGDVGVAVISLAGGRRSVYKARTRLQPCGRVRPASRKRVRARTRSHTYEENARSGRELLQR